jgi:uncharacterized membrane protein affecting hemolysin expression
MAKSKRTRKTAKKVSYKTTNRLSILLIILALLVFALAAYTMSVQGNQTSTSNQVKIAATPTPKPVVKK